MSDRELKRHLHGNCGTCGFDGMRGEAAYRAHDCRAELTKQILAEQSTRPAATDGSALACVQNIRDCVDVWLANSEIECRGDDDCDHCAILSDLHHIEAALTTQKAAVASDAGMLD